MINNLKTAMASIGGSVDEYENFFCLDAPSGYVWRATGNPGYTIHWANHSQTWLAEAIRAETESLRMGLEKVTDAKELESHRWTLGDDEWGAPDDAPARLEWPL